ncbi:uncharacterized protein LOC135925052 isoform X2 [Gordionus sp. m RMFG-2023]|uniref:uncharacterized protein LOC135925052 isoform X2 n=1 Tax=Gordionus sp. m RMFG-2023 TaxID=3053472 RepID=UPI0031FCF8BA
MVERANCTLQNSLLKCTKGNQKDWPGVLPGIVFAYNTSTHESSKFTPYEMMYGRKALLPCEDDREPDTDLDDLSDTDYESNYKSTADNMEVIFKTATKNIAKAQLKQQRDYKTRNAAKNALYHINDKVLVWNNRRADRKGGKMLQPWVGPYTIIKIVNSNVELSSLTGKILRIKTNLSNLKHYIEGNKETVKKPNNMVHCETIVGVQDQVCRLLKTIVGEGEEETLFEEMSCEINVAEETKILGLEIGKEDTNIIHVKRKDTFGEDPTKAYKSIVREGGYVGIQDQDDEIVDTIIPKKIGEVFLPTTRNWKVYHSKLFNFKVIGRYPKIESGILKEIFTTDHIVGDGNCFFRCISQEISNSQDNYNYLREKCVAFMRSNDFKLEMEKFIGYPVEEYLIDRNVIGNGVWATEVEILSMATLLQTNILIYTQYKWAYYSPMKFFNNIKIFKENIYLCNENNNHFVRIISM